MKKLLMLVIIIALPIISYFQYVNWKRYTTPAIFSYPISDKIDINYHDANLVRQYYENAIEIGRFAKEVYTNSEVDVLAPDNTNSEALNTSKYYHGMISSTKYLETILVKSAKAKELGLTNDDVKLVESIGINPNSLTIYKMKEQYLDMQLGSKGIHVWKLQKALIDRGYELPLDGNFGEETDLQLKAFQTSIATFSNAIVDEYTFMKLMVK